MTRVYIYGQRSNPRYTLVRGMIRGWLIERQIPAMWSPMHKGWHVRTERVGDLIAQAELDGFEVRMKGELR
jgi:hypothetical protein